MTSVKQSVGVLDQALAELTDRIIKAQRRVADLEVQAERTAKRLAAGTRDVTQELITAEWSTVPTRPDVKLPSTLLADLERIWRAQPVSAADAALLLGVPVAHVARELRTLRRRHSVANAGTAEKPLWSWVLGDTGSTTELVTAVERLLKTRPMTLAELQEITGARRNRISGALVILRRHGTTLKNEGNGFRAVWSIPVAPLRKRNPAR